MEKSGTPKLTPRRVRFFLKLQEAIERRGTLCARRLYNRDGCKPPKDFYSMNENEIHYIDEESIWVKEAYCGKDQITEFPIACLWSDEALEEFILVHDKEMRERRTKEEEQEIALLKRLQEKYKDIPLDKEEKRK